MHATTCTKCGVALKLTDEFCDACGEPTPLAGAEIASAAVAPAAAGPRPTLAEPAELDQLRAATLGHYDILGELGRGGMATVYLAHEIALERKVAIKVMSPALALGDGVERFKREARTSASLSHPNIIPIYAVHHSDQLLYFIMKYVEGRPLDTIIRELGTLPIPMVQAILGQIASAFGYAHRRGVVHRDIKPGNILIDDEGWAVVTDFGIAKVAEVEQLTQTGLAVGTPTYMSPEQVTAQSVSGASDQYSLGVVAYEMLTGKPPFHGGGTMAMMYAHVHQPPSPIERADCPEPLRDAVMRMLAKDPEARWPSVEDAISAIGAPPLSYDDPTRSQLIALARTGAQQRLAGLPRTPRSPIPLLRTPAPRTAGSAPARAPALDEPSARALRPSAAIRLRRQSRVSLGVAAGGIVVAALALVFRGRPAAVPAASADTAVTAAVEPGPLPPGVTAADTVPAPAAAPGPADTAATSARGGSHAKEDRAGGRRPAAAARQSNAPPMAASPAAADAGSPHATPSPAAESSAAMPAAAAPSAAAPSAGSDPSRAYSGAAALLGTNAPAAAPAPTVRKDVERVLRAYASAIDRGNAAEAQRLFPTMAPGQRSYLGSFFGAGGRMETHWKVSDIAVTGDSATARVRGTTRTLPANGSASDDRVDIRAVLRRVGGTWQLQSL